VLQYHINFVIECIIKVINLKTDLCQKNIIAVYILTVSVMPNCEAATLRMIRLFLFLSIFGLLCQNCYIN